MEQEFRMLITSVEREGINDLIGFIENTDFFTAPASTKHHGAKKGGLLEHSLMVYKYLDKLDETFHVLPDSSKSSLEITALCHDLCKADYYTVAYRNSKENGQWVKVPYYTVEDDFPAGHGEKSVIILQRFIKLTDDELMAIRWHMGGFDDTARGGYAGSSSMGTAFARYPLITALHAADMLATNWDKV